MEWAKTGRKEDFENREQNQTKSRLVFNKEKHLRDDTENYSCGQKSTNSLIIGKETKVNSCHQGSQGGTSREVPYLKFFHEL
jgi:hypothetical protein